MKSILEEIYNGKIYPAEQIISKDTKYRSLNQKLSNSIESWKKKLSEEDYTELEALLALHDEMSELQAYESYNYGFKLGASIMFEVLNGMKELIHNE